MRRILSVLCTVLVSVTMIFCKPLPRVEASSAVVGYTAYEIISLIMAVCGGGVLHATQGILGNVGYDPAKMYNSMNTYRSGLGDILSSYVARGSYLGAGSYLRINEADFEAFREYFQNNTVTNEISLGDASQSMVSEALTDFAGFSVNANSTIMNFVENYPVDVLYMEESNGRVWCALMVRGNWRTHGNYIVTSNPNYAQQKNGGWTTLAPSALWATDMSTFRWAQLNASVAGKYNEAIKTVSQEGKLDNISKTRKYNVQTGEYEGDVSIAMPKNAVLDEVLAQDDISSLYDVINAYPVNTADNTMVLYPSASAMDFVVPEIAINQTIAFPTIDGMASNYTMDLSSFFPFCIPFDIVAFIELFEADAEAPSVTYPFPFVTRSGQIGTVEQTISLSQFDGVAALVRRLELIAFIIGLAVVTRSWFLRG